MSEFAKILITALSSFAVGIVSEPVRSALTTFIQAKRLRRALYIELGMLHKSLAKVSVDTGEDSKHFYAELLRCITFETYKHAKTKPDVFYSLAEAVNFDDLYQMFNFAFIHYSKNDNQKGRCAKNDDDAIELGRRLLTIIDEELTEGGFNDDLLREVSQDYAEYAREPLAKAASCETN